MSTATVACWTFVALFQDPDADASGYEASARHQPDEADENHDQKYKQHSKDKPIGSYSRLVESPGNKLRNKSFGNGNKNLIYLDTDLSCGLSTEQCHLLSN